MAGKQATAFLQGEGDRWYQRNRSKPREPDRVLDAIEACGLKPKDVCEIGCGDGWRLRNIHRYSGARCVGFDPSLIAINIDTNNSTEFDGRYRIARFRGTADHLKGLKPNSMDLVIYGFCLYLVDREDLFKVVAECDRVLRAGGHVVIQDFIGNPTNPSYSRIYEHAPELRSYKMDYGGLWLGHPAYQTVYKKIFGTRTDTPENYDDRVVVQILKKDMEGAFPLMVKAS